MRQICAGSVFDTGYRLLGFKDAHEPLHREMCEWIDVDRWTEDMRGMLVPRAHLKSSFGSIALPITLWLRHPHLRIQLVHAVKTMSVQYGGEIQRHLEYNKLLKKIAPDCFHKDPRRESDIWLTDRFNIKIAGDSELHDKVPSFSAAGLDSESTGFHFDLIIIDDAVTGENCVTENRRDKVEKYIRDAQARLRPGGKVLILGTRWHPDDAYERLMETGIPFLVKGAYDEKGEVIFPLSKSGKAGFTKESLEERRRNMRRAGDEELFNLQYLNNAKTNTDRRLKVEFVQRIDDFHSPEAVRAALGDDAVIATTVDLCNSDRPTADFAVALTAAINRRGEIYVLEVSRGHYLGPAMVDVIRRHVDKWEPFRVFVESVGYQANLKHWLHEEMLRTGRSYPVVNVMRHRNSGTKDDRIMKLAYLFEAEGLRVCQSAFDTFRAECQAFRPGTDSKKDQLDALEMFYEMVKRPKGLQEDVAERKKLLNSRLLEKATYHLRPDWQDMISLRRGAYRVH